MDYEEHLIYDHLRRLQDYMMEYYLVASSQGREDELAEYIERIRSEVKEFIYFRDSLVRNS